MDSMLVSIITPMYNAEKYIGDTIQSVLDQTYTNWEMIIIDDASTDQSAKIVARFTSLDSRIRYYLQASNSGVANARNVAISKARGRYLAFLDSDDLWKPQKLENQLHYMQKTGVAFCYSACQIIDKNGQSTGKVRRVPKMLSYEKLLHGNEIPCLTVMIDRLQVKNIYMPSIRHEDYAAWLDILRTGVIAYGLPEELAYYREAGGSLSGNKIKAIGWTWKIYREYLKLGLVKSTRCFIGYLWNAVKKRV